MTEPMTLEVRSHLSKTVAHGVLEAGANEEEHALLGLGQHDLVGVHAGLAAGHLGDVEEEASAALAHALDGGAGEARGAEVLHAGDALGARLQRLQAGLDEDLLEEGVAHLHGGAQLLRVLQGLGREAGRAVDAVAAGVGADEQQQIAAAGGLRAHEVIGGDEADAHGVHEGVAVVAGREGDLAADVGHADAVAVPGDALDDAVEEAPGALGVGGAEAQGVQERDGAGAHGEDVSDDAADAGCRALEGLDGRGVVVRLDLEDDGEAAAHVDDAGVLGAGGHEDAGGIAREQAKEGPRVLVGAVLAPEGAEEAELEAVRLPVEAVDDALVLLRTEGDLPEGFRVDGHV